MPKEKHCVRFTPVNYELIMIKPGAYRKTELSLSRSIFKTNDNILFDNFLGIFTVKNKLK